MREGRRQFQSCYPHELLLTMLLKLRVKMKMKQVNLTTMLSHGIEVELAGAWHRSQQGGYL
jgi:hypothetical protein